MNILNPNALREWTEEDLANYHEQLRVQIARLAIIEQQVQEEWDRRYPK